MLDVAGRINKAAQAGLVAEADRRNLEGDRKVSFANDMLSSVTDLATAPVSAIPIAGPLLNLGVDKVKDSLLEQAIVSAVPKAKDVPKHLKMSLPWRRRSGILCWA